MTIWQILAIFCLGALLSLTLIAIWLGEEEDDKVESPKLQITFSEEDLALTEFLETRQAINEDFLVAQKELLDILKCEKRNF
ncbi:hypothetical protein [Streptococcus suis]|uniref:Uncharacterized protein n=1 Tax=Streptococcus suis TaxID=1307 RepID=A0A116QXK4_STRSU|nr:hypothetical protein [Streptococcus suis]NQR96521.1 hypothetical protein [Streptococcus suis]CYX37142.1 Uncharacterised protein [Streptococcus suis]